MENMGLQSNVATIFSTRMSAYIDSSDDDFTTGKDNSDKYCRGGLRTTQTVSHPSRCGGTKSKKARENRAIIKACAPFTKKDAQKLKKDKKKKKAFCPY